MGQCFCECKIRAASSRFRYGGHFNSYLSGPEICYITRLDDVAGISDVEIVVVVGVSGTTLADTILGIVVTMLFVCVKNCMILRSSSWQ